jgi:hypothetical protein
MQININSKQANLILECLNEKLNNPELFSDEEILYSLLNNNLYNVEEVIEGDEIIEEDEIIEDDNSLNYYISSDDE